jgi:hypothetical protein
MSICSAQPTTSVVDFLSPHMHYCLGLIFQGDKTSQAFPVSTATIYIISNTKTFKNIVFYLVCSCKLHHRVFKKSIGRIYENVCHSLFRSWLVILTILPSILDSVLCSEKPFSKPGIQFTFDFWILNAGCLTADCRHRPLKE